LSRQGHQTTERGPQPEEHFANVRGVRLRYVDWGDNGPPALFLHGDMRTARSWDAVARDIFDRFHILALDSRGHGDSDWPDSGYTFADRTEDLAQFCDAVGLTGAIGVGHSTGGAVITLLADRSPGLFNGLVLLEPTMTVDEGFQRMVSSRAKRPRRTWGSRQELYDYLKGHNLAGRWRDDVIRDVVDHEALELPDGTLDMKWSDASVNWAEREGDYLDLKPVFSRLDLPILFIMSDDRQNQQSFRGMRTIAERVPDFNLLTVNDSGHNMYMERPDAVSRAISAFASGESLPPAI
jgi:pimeloyl-ACP methyl ester carboxylesterase